MISEYRFLKCLNDKCGHIFQSNVTARYPQCSKCRKSKFLVIEKGKEIESAEIKHLTLLVKSLEARVSVLETGMISKNNVPAVIESPTPPRDEVTDIVEESTADERLKHLQDKYKK